MPGQGLFRSVTRPFLARFHKISMAALTAVVSCKRKACGEYVTSRQSNSVREGVRIRPDECNVSVGSSFEEDDVSLKLGTVILSSELEATFQ